MLILALIPDLIFSTKVFSTAKSLNLPIQAVRSLETLAQRLADPDLRLILIDLNAAAPDPLAAIRLIKQIPPSPASPASPAAPSAAPPRIIAFLSHVQTELAAAAKDAGADLVLPRSQFSAQLPALLQSSQDA